MFEILKQKQVLTLDYAKAALKHCNKVEEVLLQNDTSVLVEEKVASIAMASTFMWVVGGIIGLFVSLTGVGLVLFVIGWILSKIINRQVYGRERKVESLNSDEKELLEIITRTSVELKALAMKMKIASKARRVVCVNYPQRRFELDRLLQHIEAHNPSNLSVKYRALYVKRVASHRTLSEKLNRSYQIVGV